MRAEGMTLQQIADVFGITPERVRQIIKHEGGPGVVEARAARAAASRRRDAGTREKLLRLMTENPGSTREQIAQMAKVDFHDVSRLLGDDVQRLVTRRAGRPAFTDEDIIDALQAAAKLQGEPLSHVRYNAVALRVNGPSSIRIIQRYGTWSAACRTAGVRAGATPRREYRRQWTELEVLGAVVEYLTSSGTTGTFAGYDEWSREVASAPSGGTVRSMLGQWSDVKRSALLVVEAANRRAA